MTQNLPYDERKVSDLKFFEGLDPDMPALARIRTAAERGDLEKARAGIVEHFRKRRKPKWFYDFRDMSRGNAMPPWFALAEGVCRRADDALRYMLHLRNDESIHVFDKNLRWKTKEMRGVGSRPSTFKRTYFLMDLAIAHAETRKPAYARKFAELIDRFLTDWPLVVDADFGPNMAVFSKPDGQKAMPTAFRLYNWIVALYSGIVFAPEVPTETTFRMLKSMWFIARQYRRFEESEYHPANHHLWERGSVPVLIGLMFPEFPELRGMIAQGAPVIARHVRESFLPDGGYEERSTCYTLASLNMFLMPVDLAERNGVRLLNDKEKEILCRCIENLASITLPDGSLPDIGDERNKPSGVVRVLGAGARDLGARRAAGVLRDLGLTGMLDQKTLSRVAKARPEGVPLVVHQPDSGYFVAREAMTPRASAMALSVPPPGLPNHAHDDALSLQLFVKGVPMVGTPLSETYMMINEQRYRGRMLRGQHYAMTSHNVVLVGGKPVHDPMDLSDKWGPPPNPCDVAFSEYPGGVCVKASHSGFEGVRLSREVLFVHGEGWTVRDSVEGDAEGEHMAQWHFEYDVELRRVPGGFEAWHGRTGLGVSFHTPGSCRVSLKRDRVRLRQNPLRPGATPPWILHARFGSGAPALLETRFRVLSG